MPMKTSQDKFKTRVEDGIHDAVMRGNVSAAQERLQSRKAMAEEELGEWQKWRELAEHIRQHTLENLDYYLEQLSDNVARRGGHVYFASTKEEATRYIQEVARQKQAKTIVKSKSMVTEEIHMNSALESIGCDVIESDLGEYILQVDDHDPPSHIVAPALHKNRSQIRDVFRDKFGYKGSDQPTEMTKYVRGILREKFLQADIGITGCNLPSRIPAKCAS